MVGCSPVPARHRPRCPARSLHSGCTGPFRVHNRSSSRAAVRSARQNTRAGRRAGAPHTSHSALPSTTSATLSPAPFSRRHARRVARAPYTRRVRTRARRARWQAVPTILLGGQGAVRCGRVSPCRRRSSKCGQLEGSETQAKPSLMATTLSALSTRTNKFVGHTTDSRFRGGFATRDCRAEASQGPRGTCVALARFDDRTPTARLRRIAARRAHLPRLLISPASSTRRRLAPLHRSSNTHAAALAVV